MDTKRLNDQGIWEYLVSGEWRTVKQLAMRHLISPHLIYSRVKAGVEGEKLIAPAAIKGKLSKFEASDKRIQKGLAMGYTREATPEEIEQLQEWKQSETISPYDPEEPEDWPEVTKYLDQGK